MKTKTTLTTLIFSLIALLSAQEAQPYPPLYLVSIPTAGTLPKGTYTLEMLLENHGGILPKLAVGLTDHFTIGMSFGVQKFIGDVKAELNKQTPEVQLKYRVYEENTSWPAVVIGLDTQGRGAYHEKVTENDTTTVLNRYDQKAWGVYVVASKNWNMLGNLGMHVGISKNNWENKDGDSDIDFFFGFDKQLNRTFSLLLEYDAALNDNADAYDINTITFGKGRGYLNAGLRWAIAPGLMLEFDVNNITLNNNASRYSNREVKILYSESF
ncbi:MAG: YjbH domain-containing protein [FCB group bacterium]|nr:YjbH domain-containing protein [FCB group bacterium]